MARERYEIQILQFEINEVDDLSAFTDEPGSKLINTDRRRYSVVVCFHEELKDATLDQRGLHL